MGVGGDQHHARVSELLISLTTHPPQRKELRLVGGVGGKRTLPDGLNRIFAYTPLRPLKEYKQTRHFPAAWCRLTKRGMTTRYSETGMSARVTRKPEITKVGYSRTRSHYFTWWRARWRWQRRRRREEALVGAGAIPFKVCFRGVLCHQGLLFSLQCPCLAVLCPPPCSS